MEIIVSTWRSMLCDMKLNFVTLVRMLYNKHDAVHYRCTPTIYSMHENKLLLPFYVGGMACRGLTFLVLTAWHTHIITHNYL